jgi:hypothetical protein
METMFYDAYSFHQDLSSWTIHADCLMDDWMKGTLLDYYQSRREDTIASTKQFKEELIATTWHPSRVEDWCFDGEME